MKSRNLCVVLSEDLKEVCYLYSSSEGFGPIPCDDQGKTFDFTINTAMERIGSLVQPSESGEEEMIHFHRAIIPRRTHFEAPKDFDFSLNSLMWFKIKDIMLPTNSLVNRFVQTLITETIAEKTS